MVYLEGLMLREEDGMDGEVTDVESDHEEDKGEEDADDMEILGAHTRESERARVQQICYTGITLIILVVELLRFLPLLLSSTPTPLNCHLFGKCAYIIHIRDQPLAS